MLPDGRAHLLVDLSRPAEPEAVVVGPRRTGLVVRCATWTRVFGVRFHAGAARRFLGVPLGEIADRRIALADIRGDAPSMCERLAEADLAGRLPAALDSELLAWRTRAERPEPRVRSVVARLQREAEFRTLAGMAPGQLDV